MFSFVADLLFPGVCLTCDNGLSAPEGNSFRVLPGGWPPGTPVFFQTDFFHPVLGPLKVPARLLCADCWLSLVPAEKEYRLRGCPSIPVLSPFITNPVLLEVIRFLKFRNGRSSVHSLSWWLALSLERHLETNPHAGPGDLTLVPVPLSRSRLAARGYNQAGLLAGQTARILCLRYSTDTLRRTRNTRPQSKLDRLERMTNVRGAFAAEPDAVEGKKIVVVDDLLTTGETMLACINALQVCRPLSIMALTVGRGADR